MDKLSAIFSDPLKALAKGSMMWVCAAAATAPAVAATNHHALLIGVSDYADERITDLEGPEHDVASLREVPWWMSKRLKPPS